jgi:L-malate glycosyltransferase
LLFPGNAGLLPWVVRAGPRVRLVAMSITSPNAPGTAGARSDQEPRVLYLSHTSVVGGAERALLDHMRVMPEAFGRRPVMCPPGEFAELLRGEGISVIEFPGTAASFHVTARNLFRAAKDFTLSAIKIRRAVRATGANVIHANSIRAGLLSFLAVRRRRPAVIVHVHDVLPDGVVSGVVRAILLRRSAALIGVSAFTRANLLKGYPESRVIFPVMINPIDAGELLENAPDRGVARGVLGVADDIPLLGVVGQITPWKGQDTAIRALPTVLETLPEARLLIVGETRFVDSTRFDNRTYKADLLALVESLGVSHAVTFCGQRDDVPTVMRALDLMLQPSWVEPLGRSVVEAMVLGTPVVATTRGGPAELITDGETGYLAAPREPDAWARVIVELLSDPGRRESAAKNAQRTVIARLDLGRYVAEMTSLYEQVLPNAASVSA